MSSVTFSDPMTSCITKSYSRTTNELPFGKKLKSVEWWRWHLLAYFRWIDEGKPRPKIFSIVDSPPLALPRYIRHMTHSSKRFNALQNPNLAWNVINPRALEKRSKSTGTLLDKRNYLRERLRNLADVNDLLKHEKQFKIHSRPGWL